MGQLRTANKRHNRTIAKAIAAGKAAETATAKAPVTAKIAA